MAIFLKAGTSDLSKITSYKELINNFKDVTGNNNQSDYPYNVLSQNMLLQASGAQLFKNGLRDLRGELLSVPNLNPEMGSMNEAVRGNAYNYENQSNNSNKGSSYSPTINDSNQNSYSNNNTALLMSDLEKINRNNPNKIISQEYNSFEDIGKIIKDFHKKTK